MKKVTLDLDSPNEFIFKNRIIVSKDGEIKPITAEDLTLVVFKKAGEEYQKDCSCDSRFMLDIMEEMGDHIRRYFWFLPIFVSIYLIIDNAGGHGSNEAKKEYREFLRDKFNIILIFQIPNSPETNLLDLGVWRALQALVEKMSFRERYDPDVLAATVAQAWIEFSSEPIEKVYQRWELVLRLICLDQGGNRFVEQFRGKLTGDPTVENITFSKLAERQPRKMRENRNHQTQVNHGTEYSTLSITESSVRSISIIESSARAISENDKKVVSSSNDKIDKMKANENEIKVPHLPLLIDDDHTINDTDITFIRDTLNRKGRLAGDVVASLGTDTVLQENMETLAPGEWLTDEIIHYFFVYLPFETRTFFLKTGVTSSQVSFLHSCFQEEKRVSILTKQFGLGKGGCLDRTSST